MKNIMYSVANSGGRLYPVSVCLQMTLAYKKDYYQIYELENISGNPLICPLSSRQAKYLKFSVDDAYISI